MLKNVENLTADEFKWLHDNDFFTLFNGRKMKNDHSVLSWRIDIEGVGRFLGRRYKSVIDVDKIEINRDLRMVSYEGWLSVKDLLFKKKLIVRCSGFANSVFHLYEVITNHTEDELYQLMNMTAPGKVLKVELMEQTIDDLAEELAESGLMGGELNNEK
ncbi:hypothetical protein ACSFC1_10870 [Pseudothermotoga sp. U03pept]|uniref:hypothetical protein n=1 Tax=Pseudothermotoga sp. U03pept TaxID=3447012 RepID=UPI003EFF6E94